MGNGITMISDVSENFYGKYKSLKNLFAMLNESDNRRGHRTASSLIHRYNNEFRAIKSSNLRRDIKKQAFGWLKQKYKKTIFEDIQKLSQKEKTHLYNFIVARWREYIRSNNEKQSRTYL